MTPSNPSNRLPSGNGPARDEGVADWQSHPFLEGLSPEHLTALVECAMPSGFEAGEVVFREGEIANRFYLILQGRVVLEAAVRNHPPVPVDSVGAGGVLGWSWLFPPCTWHFTARAIQPVQAIFFYGTWLRERCAADPAFGYELMRRTATVVVRRLQAARLQLIHLATGPRAA